MFHISDSKCDKIIVYVSEVCDKPFKDRPGYQSAVTVWNNTERIGGEREDECTPHLWMEKEIRAHTGSS